MGEEEKAAQEAQAKPVDGTSPKASTSEATPAAVVQEGDNKVETAAAELPKEEVVGSPKEEVASTAADTPTPQPTEEADLLGGSEAFEKIPSGGSPTTTSWGTPEPRFTGKEEPSTAPALQPPTIVTREVAPEPAEPVASVSPVAGVSPQDIGQPVAVASPVPGVSPQDIGLAAPMMGEPPSLKLESALLTPEPASNLVTGLEALNTPLQSVPEESLTAESSAAQAAVVEDSAVSTAPASPETSPERQAAASSADSKGALADPGLSKAPRRMGAPPTAPVGQAVGGSWRWGAARNNQTSAYQRLGTSEANPTALPAHTAISEPSEPTTAATLASSKAYPVPAARHLCGHQRLVLRGEYNKKEVNAALLLQKFDANGNGVLEPEEFRSLLNNWISDSAHPAWRKYVKDEDLEYIMAVADKNHDDRISQDEILFALQAWYSFNYMPFEVNANLGRKSISADGSPMPSIEALQQILIDLNGFQSVDMEEVMFVRNLAFTLGATEEKVTLLQLRRAIAIWYINVEREPTDMKGLMEDSVTTLASYVHHHSKRILKKVPSTQDIAANMPFRQYLSDQPTDLESGASEGAQDSLLTSDAPRVEPIIEEYEDCEPPVLFSNGVGPDESPLWLGISFWTVFFLLPGWYMVHAGSNYPSLPACEHDLGTLLMWKGYLSLIVGVSGFFQHTLHEGHFQYICMAAGIIGLILLFLQEFLGCSMTLNSSPDKCGDYIWNVNVFFFVWSLLWGPALCCCMTCCLSVCAVTSVAYSRRDMELYLHPENGVLPSLNTEVRNSLREGPDSPDDAE